MTMPEPMTAPLVPTRETGTLDSAWAVRAQSPDTSPPSSMPSASEAPIEAKSAAKDTNKQLNGVSPNPAEAELEQFASPWVFWTRNARLSPGAAGSPTATKITRTNWLQQLAPVGEKIQTAQQLRALSEHAEGKLAVLASMEQAPVRLGVRVDPVKASGAAAPTLPGETPKVRGAGTLPPRPDAALRIATSPPSDSWDGSLVHALFVKGIQPAWEDPANLHGGSWSVQLSHPRPAQHVWALWYALMEAAASETLDRPMNQRGQRRRAPKREHGSNVTGVMLRIKPRSVRLSIWTNFSDVGSLAPEAQAIVDVGQQFVHLLQLSMAGRIRSQRTKRSKEGGPDPAPSELVWPHEVRFAPHHTGPGILDPGTTLPLAPPSSCQTKAKNKREVKALLAPGKNQSKATKVEE